MKLPLNKDIKSGYQNDLRVQLPLYHLPVFKCPKLLVKRLEKFMYDILWKGMDKSECSNLVNWNVTYRPISKASLGAGNLIVRNAIGLEISGRA